MNKIFSPFTSNERKKSYVDDDKKKNANKKVVMAEDFLWDIDSLNASNFEIGIKFVKKCIAWLKLKNAHNYEGIFRKAGEVERLEVLQKEISAKVNSNADFSFGDNEDVHVVATILKRYLRGMKEPLLTFDQYDAFIASDNFSDNEMRFSSIRFALSLIPTINHTMLFEVLFYFNEVSKHEEVNMMSSRNLAIVLAPNILRSEGNKSPIQILTDSAHANSIVETLIKDTSHIFGSDDLKPEAAAKFRQTMRDIYHVTQRHGEKVLKKLKEESHLSPEQFDEKLKECVEKVKNGEIDSELLFGASGMKKATKATPSRLAIPDFDAVERPTSEEKASPSLSPHKEANDRPTSEKRAVPKSRENKLREDKGVVRHETIKPVDRRGRKYHTIGDVEHSSHDDEGNREASPSPSPEPSTRVDLTARPDSSRVSKSRKTVFNSMPASQGGKNSDDVASMRGSGSNSKISRNSSRDLRKNLSDQELEEKRSSRRDYQDRVPTLKDLSLEAENISLTPPRGNSKSPGREKSPKGERELTRKSSHKRRELSHSSSAPNCERPSSLVVKKAISLSGENSKEVSAEKSQDSPSSSAREKMKDNSSSRIVREVKIKRSSENLTSLLSGLTGLQQETVLLFKLSEDEQRNLDDEVEEAMKEILSGCENVFDVKK